MPFSYSPKGPGNPSLSFLWIWAQGLCGGNGPWNGRECGVDLSRDDDHALNSSRVVLHPGVWRRVHWRNALHEFGHEPTLCADIRLDQALANSTKGFCWFLRNGVWRLSGLVASCLNRFFPFVWLPPRKANRLASTWYPLRDSTTVDLVVPIEGSTMLNE